MKFSTFCALNKGYDSTGFPGNLPERTNVIRFRHLANLFLVACTLFLAGTGPKTAWREFSSGWFKVQLPGPAKKSANDSWVAVDSHKSAYNVSATPLKDTPGDPSNYLQETAEMIVDRLHGRMEKRNYFKFHGSPAFDCGVENDQHHLGIRLILSPRVLYLLQYAADPKAFDPGAMGKFFDSFKITGKAPRKGMAGEEENDTENEGEQPVQAW